MLVIVRPTFFPLFRVLKKNLVIDTFACNITIMFEPTIDVEQEVAILFFHHGVKFEVNRQCSEIHEKEQCTKCLSMM